MQLVAAEESKESNPQTEKSEDRPAAQVHTVRKSIISHQFAGIPPVLMTAGHRKLCKIGVGDSFPHVMLPRMNRGMVDLASLRGKKATVVVFWRLDRWMARTALIDLQRDVADRFDAGQIAVVGIALEQSNSGAQRWTKESKITFPQLLDSSGAALAQVGRATLPRIYVLDQTGKVVWFDIEYSEGTRRELAETLAVLAPDDSTKSAGNP